LASLPQVPPQELGAPDGGAVGVGVAVGATVGEAVGVPGHTQLALSVHDGLRQRLVTLNGQFSASVGHGAGTSVQAKPEGQLSGLVVQPPLHLRVGGSVSVGVGVAVGVGTTVPAVKFIVQAVPVTPLARGQLAGALGATDWLPNW